MYPVGGGAVLVLAMLHDTLVEGKIRDEPLHPAPALGEGGDAEVGCFALHVLAKWFEDFGAESLDVGNYLCLLRNVRIERVVDAVTACGS